MLSHLTGLLINVNERSAPLEVPSHHLQHLKELQLASLYNLDSVEACLRMASPGTLQTLSLHLVQECGHDEVSLILVPQRWMKLETLYLYDGPAHHSLPSHFDQFPALRHVQLDFAHSDFIKETFSVLPMPPESIHMSHISMRELVDILNLVKDGQWLRSRLHKIRLDIENVCNYGWNAALYPKQNVMAIADAAIIAAQAKDVSMEPEDLVGALADFAAWEDQQF
jgi:hypothetical protein